MGTSIQFGIGEKKTKIDYFLVAEAQKLVHFSFLAKKATFYGTFLINFKWCVIWFLVVRWLCSTVISGLEETSFSLILYVVQKDL